MDIPHIITICMGSSCFARGNRRHLTLIEQFLEERGLSESVLIRGSRCEERCAEGPSIAIDGIMYQGLDEGLLLDVLELNFPRSGKD